MRVETIYALYTHYIYALYTHYIRTIYALLTLGMPGAGAGWRAGPVSRQDLALHLFLWGRLAPGKTWRTQALPRSRQQVYLDRVIFKRRDCFVT